MKIHHIALTVKNLENSKNFYKEFFGFIEIKNFKNEDLCGKASFLKLENTQLELWQFEDTKQNLDDLSDIKIRGIRHITFEVGNFDKTISDFKLKGFKISEPKTGASGHRYAFFNDPDGITLELYEK